MLGAALIGAGVATLVHAGYSAVHFQSLIEARYGEVAASLPADVDAELALAVGLVLAGVAVSVKSFSPLYSDSEPAVKCVLGCAVDGGGSERCSATVGGWQP